MVYIKTHIFNHFYQQYLVLLTMAPRNRSSAGCRYSARIVRYTAHTGTIEGPLLHSIDGAAKKYRLKTQTTACPNVRVRPDERVRAIGIHASDRS